MGCSHFFYHPRDKPCALTAKGSLFVAFTTALNFFGTYYVCDETKGCHLDHDDYWVAASIAGSIAAVVSTAIYVSCVLKEKRKYNYVGYEVVIDSDEEDPRQQSSKDVSNLPENSKESDKGEADDEDAKVDRQLCC